MGWVSVASVTVYVYMCGILSGVCMSVCLTVCLYLFLSLSVSLSVGLPVCVCRWFKWNGMRYQ